MTTSATPTDDQSDVTDVAPSLGPQGAGRNWLAKDPIRSAMLLILGLAVAIRLNVLRDSFFFTDDFMLFSRASESRFDLQYLTRVHTGHFEPVGFAVMWLLEHLAPWNWAAAASVILIGLLCVNLLVWALLIELFGRRWRTLIPFALFCVSPLTLPATTWLSAAILWIPLMASIAGTTRWHVRYLKSGRRRDAVLAGAFFALGLLSFEKTLVLLPYLFVLTLALSPLVDADPTTRLSAVRRRPAAWVAYIGLTSAFLVTYATRASQDSSGSPLGVPSVSESLDFAYLSVVKTLVPSAFGGPWHWGPLPYGGAIVDSPRLFDWLALTLATLVVVVSLAVRRGIALHWLALGTYVASSILAVSAGRVAIGGSDLALETRYLADAAIPLVVAVGAAIGALDAEREPWDPALAQLLARVPRARTAGWAVGAAVVLLSLNSISQFAPISASNPYRSFAETTETSVKSLPREAQVYDTALSIDVVGPIFEGYNFTSRFVRPVVPEGRRAQFTPRSEYTKPYILDATGHFVPMRVVGAASPAPLPGACGWVARNGTVTVPLGSDVFAWGWAVRIGYLADGDTTATVRLGTGTGTVHLREGLGEVYLPLVGSGPQVELQGMDPRVNVCVGDVQVGNPVGK